MDKKHIFISFSSKETDEAKRICALLESEGFPCFISLRDLIAGEEYAEQLIDNIASAEAVVLLLSNESNTSPHVLREVEYAVSKRIPIIVYGLEKVELSKSMEYYLMTHQWIPADSERDKRLLDALRHLEAGEDTFKPRKPGKKTEEQIPGRGTKFILFALLIILIITLVGALMFTKLGKPEKKKSTSSKPSVTQGAEPTSSPEASPSTAPAEVSYALGDTVSFGSFGGEKITWRVIKMEDGKLYLLSKYILSMKPFDAAEGGDYNTYKGEYITHSMLDMLKDDEVSTTARGNNDWSLSNLRTWLNSDREKVDYTDQAPTKDAMGKNFYDSKPGFLFDFSTEEKEALIKVTNKTPVNSLNPAAENGYITTEDLVYLLSSDELYLLSEAGMTKNAEPTSYCIEEDKDPEFYHDFSIESLVSSYYWWLRDNPGDQANLANIVTTECESDMETYYGSVGLCSYGVRPVICIKDDCELLKKLEK